MSESGLTYRKLSGQVFFWVALVLHIIFISTAIMIENVMGMLAFCGAMFCTCLIFLYPALGFLQASSRYGT